MSPTSRTALLAATLAALTIPAGVTRANVVDVPFSLTITQSPFATGNLAVGKTITGRYGYEPVTSPAVAGPNYVKYTLSHGQIGHGTDACTSTSVALDLSHAIGLGDSPELGLVDLYEVTFYSLQGAMIDGFRPACATLYLIDADAALYADLNFPITLPPAELFEIKQARLTYTNDTGARADVVADITSIGVIPEPSSLALLGAGVAGLLTIRFGTSHRATTSRRA